MVAGETLALADGIDSAVFLATLYSEVTIGDGTHNILPICVTDNRSHIDAIKVGAMSPGCMLLFVFGFVGGAVVINSAVLVSLSVLLLVHYSVSTGGLPALPSLPSLPRQSRYRLYARCFGAYLRQSSVLFIFPTRVVATVMLQPCSHPVPAMWVCYRQTV
ncbi:hypothetical protein GOODEAATRI_024120 [Goodea atripinnis]|uniref:Uncharacterized protein n=1 Tax=Goodea atripinnis TaxID=208336 RepID=A0ABV0MKB1_9TELE